jgi:hypothetical protein
MLGCEDFKFYLSIPLLWIAPRGPIGQRRELGRGKRIEGSVVKLSVTPSSTPNTLESNKLPPRKLKLS